jgi:hypothetical protein
MTAIRSVSLIPVQAAISAAVRPQPIQRDDSGSRMQTSTQGVEGLEASTGLT